MDTVEIIAPTTADAGTVVTDGARSFLAALERTFGARRRALLEQRAARRAALASGASLAWRPESRSIREREWQLASPPSDLVDRRVEITGPMERKMMINALNSGANVFMADLEDALTPTWTNLIAGQRNLQDATRGALDFVSPEGRRYVVGPTPATLVVRPRGWHLEERHAWLGGRPMSASLFDFGLAFFHNARRLVDAGSGPYYYLPKLEAAAEAQLWDDVFTFAEETIGNPAGTIRATVLVETLPAAFEMDEILYALRAHAVGLNAGRWDYLFSVIKTLGSSSMDLPDRSDLTMTVPFMRAYTELLVQTCHRRGAHAIGGMSAYIPSRRDAAANTVALDQVRADKQREASDGFDGTWVAHPDLVPVARDAFTAVIGDRTDQKDRRGAELRTTDGMTDIRVPGGRLTEAGYRNAVAVSLGYLDSWLSGQGAVAIFNLMEDAATAEIARTLLWHYRMREARLDDGRRTDAELYRSIRDEEVARRGGRQSGRLRDAVDLLDSVVLADDLTEFLTIPASDRLA